MDAAGLCMYACVLNQNCIVLSFILLIYLRIHIGYSLVLFNQSWSGELNPDPSTGRRNTAERGWVGTTAHSKDNITGSYSTNEG